MAADGSVPSGHLPPDEVRHDPKVVRRQYASDAVDNAVVAGVTQHGDDFVIAVEKDPGAG